MLCDLFLIFWLRTIFRLPNTYIILFLLHIYNTTLTGSYQRLFYKDYIIYLLTCSMDAQSLVPPNITIYIVLMEDLGFFIWKSVIAFITLDAAVFAGNFRKPVPSAGKDIDLTDLLLASSRHLCTKLYNTCWKNNNCYKSWPVLHITKGQYFNIFTTYLVTLVLDNSHKTIKYNTVVLGGQT